MSVSLVKGNKINLSKEAGNLNITLSNVNVGLGWDCNSHGGADYDLDAWALAFDNDGAKRKNLVYFGNTVDSSLQIHHCGDNLTGEGEGDDETITFNLDKLSNKYKFILIGVTIFRANMRGQSFKNIDNAFIRIYDRKTNKEICKYGDDKFKKDFGKSISLLFGALVFNSGQWEFIAIGKGESFSSIADALNIYSEHSLDEYLTINKKDINGGKKTMAVNLSKGGKISLAKVAADAGISGGLTKIVVGLGWDVQKYDGGADFDLDAAAFMTGANGKVRSDADFIFYNQKEGPGVLHTGDNRTGEGEGDDEQIKVDLTAVPADVDKVSFTVTIDQADVRNQNFGMVENAYIHIVDEVTGTELIKYELGEDFSVENAIVVAELYRHNGEWKFNAVGSGFSGGLAALCRNFGVNV